MSFTTAELMACANDAHKDGREEERKAIVAFLRSAAIEGDHAVAATVCNLIATDLERGAHIPKVEG